MNDHKIKITFVIVLLALLASWRVTAIQSATRDQNATSKKQDVQDQLQQLLQSRYDSALKIFQIEESLVNSGRATLVNLCESARRVRDAALELNPAQKAQIEAHTQYLQVVRRFEESVNKSVGAGIMPQSDKEMARYMRYDAEIGLIKATSRAAAIR